MVPLTAITFKDQCLSYAPLPSEAIEVSFYHIVEAKCSKLTIFFLLIGNQPNDPNLFGLYTNSATQESTYWVLTFFYWYMLCS